MEPPSTATRLSLRTPLQSAPLFTVGWHNALFEHYRVIDEARIQARLPQGLLLDRHGGAAYLSIVSFRMVAMSWRGLLLPVAHTYPQINVRVYVHHGGVPGVFFLRNFVSHRLAAWAGRLMYGMPYVFQPVSLDWNDGALHCAASFKEGRHVISGHGAAPLSEHVGDPSSLPFFLVERYPLYSRHRNRLMRAHMYHPPWELRRLEVSQHSQAIPKLLGLTGALQRLDEAHCSPGVDVQMWRAEAC